VQITNPPLPPFGKGGLGGIFRENSISTLQFKKSVLYSFIYIFISNLWGIAALARQEGFRDR